MIQTMRKPIQADNRTRERFYDAAVNDNSDVDARFQFERMAPPKYRVMRPFVYVDKLGHWYRVPIHVDCNSTDFASIPSFLTWLIPKDGSHTPAAVLHDALIGGRRGDDFETSADGDGVPDRHADYLFREAMKSNYVPWLRRWAMWAAVVLRTLTITTSWPEGASKPTSRKRWLRILPVAVAAGWWAILSAGMALDVPDLISDRWTLGWLGDRSWYVEIGRAIVMIAVGSLVLSAFFGAVLQSVRGLVAGLLGGVAIGFLGLPMLASALGAAGFFVMEKTASRFVGDPKLPAPGPPCVPGDGSDASERDAMLAEAARAAQVARK